MAAVREESAEPLLAVGQQPRPSVGTYVAFTVVGLGQGWLATDALFQQVPHLQQRLPEKAALAAFLGGALTAGSMCSLCAVALLTVLRVRTSRLVEDASVAASIGATLLCLACASLGWPLTSADGSRSSALLALGAASGAIGALRMAINMPWHLRYDPRLISANLLGGTIAAALVAALAAFQGPGGESKFGPGAFFGLCALLTLPSACALGAIRYWDLGLLAPPRAQPRRAPSLHEFRGLDRPPLPAGLPTRAAAGAAAPASRAARGPLPVWLCRVLGLGGSYALAQSLIWGVTPGVLPYAAAHAAGGGRALGLTAHELLALSLQASFFGLFAGAAGALLLEPPTRLGAALALATLCSAVPLGLALDGGGSAAGPGAALALVCSVTLARALEGFVVPAIFRAVGSDEACGEARVGVQRALVICERLATMGGSVGTLWLVTHRLDPGGGHPGAGG